MYKLIISLQNILIIIIIIIISFISADDTFENSSNLCNRCNCNDGNYEFILDCQKLNFQHIIANWPEHKTPLTATFSYNNISHLEILPNSNLARKIILSHCNIKTLDNGAFKSVKSLIYLDLSYNLLTTEEISPEKFKGSYNDSAYEPLLLEDLNLSYNKIHSLPHKIFEHLQELKQLNLEGNNFKVLDLPTQAALSDLSNLQVLNLASNKLTDLDEDALKKLENLRILNLSNNLLVFIPETLSLLTNSLEAVYLDKNLIFEITDESFLGVKGIKILSITNSSKLKYVHANAFSPLKNLSVLYLSNNPILTTIDRDAFNKNQTLQELYLHNNSLQDLHYNLTKWSALRLFTLKGNDLICDCDLFKISQDLNWQIKRDKNSPFCINPITDSSLMIYNLTQDACNYEHETYRISHTIEHHFTRMKMILIIITTILVLTGTVAVLLTFLRYRRNRLNRNYPFITQVTYNPLRNSNNIN